MMQQTMVPASQFDAVVVVVNGVMSLVVVDDFGRLVGAYVLFGIQRFAVKAL